MAGIRSQKRDFTIISCFSLYSFLSQWIMYRSQFDVELTAALKTAIHQTLTPIPLLVLALFFVRKLPFVNKNRVRFFAVHIILAGLYSVFTEIIYFSVMAALNGTAQAEQALHYALQNWLIASMFDNFTEYALIVSVGYLFIYIDRLKSQSEIEKSLRKELKIAQLDALKSQLNPHFLFNSLHNIHALIKADPKNARKIVLLLSEYLRKVLQLQNHHFITIEEELEQAERYLKIEKIRFGERLDATVKNEIERECYIPTLLLQPIIENAVKHGVSQSKNLCRVEIRLRETSGRVEISVYNDTIAASPPTGHAIGLKNLEKRLKTNFHKNYNLEIDNQNGFRIKVAFPVIEALE